MRKKYSALPADPADALDFAVTPESMERGQQARLIRKVRDELGLSQAEFAARLAVPVGTLRDWEQARATVFAMRFLAFL